MNDPRYPEFEPPSTPETPSEGGIWLPGGVSLQTAATVLLVVMLATVLWLFFGPTDSSAPPGLPTQDAAANTPLPGGATAPITTALGAAETPVSIAAAPGSNSATPAVAVAPDAATAGSAAPGTPAAVAPAVGGQFIEGGFVKVGNADGLGIRLRFGPGLDFATIRIVMDGSSLKVTGGPETGDGETWYRLQDDLGNIGWAAVTFLTPADVPATWSPPAASPTFEAGQEGYVEVTPTP